MQNICLKLISWVVTTFFNTNTGKVEEWLSDEEAREKGARAPEEHTKLHEAESENRNLRNALVEAQMKATMLQTQLTQKRNEYLDLFNALHS